MIPVSRNEPYERASVAFELGQLDTAERVIGDALSRTPDDYRLFRLLAQIRIQQQRWQQARDCSQRALSLEPMDAGSMVLLAWGIAADNDYPIWRESKSSAFPSLESTYQQSDDLSSKKRTTQSQNSRGDGFDQRMEKARLLIQQAKQLEPYEPSIWNTEAQFDLIQSRYESAAESAREGLKHDPDHSGCLESLVKALTELGQIEEAEAISLQLLANSPENAESHSLLSRVYLQQGNAQQAFVHAAQAVRLDPTNDSVREQYWDAIKSRSVFMRPIVKLQFAAKRFQQKSWEARFGLVLLAMFGCWLIGWGIQTWLHVPTAVSCTIVGLVIGILASSDRPAMALTDIWMLHDSEFRRVFDKRKLLHYFIGFALILTLLIVPLGVNTSAGQTLAMMAAAIPFLYSIVRLANAGSSRIRIAFSVQLLIMAAFAAHVGYAIVNSGNPHLSRIWPAASGVFFVATAFAGLAIQEEKHSIRL